MPMRPQSRRRSRAAVAVGGGACRSCVPEAWSSSSSARPPTRLPCGDGGAAQPSRRGAPGVCSCCGRPDRRRSVFRGGRAWPETSSCLSSLRAGGQHLRARQPEGRRRQDDDGGQPGRLSRRGGGDDARRRSRSAGQRNVGLGEQAEARPARPARRRAARSDGAGRRGSRTCTSSRPRPRSPAPQSSWPAARTETSSFRPLFAPARGRYDFTFVDCPPSLGPLTP